MNKTGKIKRGLLFVVSAPTGGGKSTLVMKALQPLREKFLIEKITTFTTRPQRATETAGQDYEFVSEKEFLELAKQGFFLETTVYNNFHYGSPKNFIPELKNGKSFIAITDRKGVASYKKLCDAAVSIWINPPSFEVLKKRLIIRNSEDPINLENRLSIALKEMEAEKTTPLCTYHIINDDISKAAAELCSIIEKELITKN